MSHRLDDLPTELLLNILSFLDNLQPVSSSSRTLSALARDCQARELRARISRICQADLLVQIWSPPTFFCRDARGRRRSPGYVVSHPHELANVLCDPPAMLPLVEAYIASLEHRADICREVARHLVRMVNFAGVPGGSSQSRVLMFATSLVIHLWSVRQRHGHDIDGYLLALSEGEGRGGASTFRELCARDPYLAGLPEATREGLVASYHALGRHLQPPFGPPGGGESLWLQRLIAQVSVETPFPPPRAPFRERTNFAMRKGRNGGCAG